MNFTFIIRWPLALVAVILVGGAMITALAVLAIVLFTSYAIGFALQVVARVYERL